MSARVSCVYCKKVFKISTEHSCRKKRAREEPPLTTTITFSECVENHAGMMKHGICAPEGLSKDHLKKIQQSVNGSCVTELVDLDVDGKGNASILILRALFSSLSPSVIVEQSTLERDFRVFMRGSVKDKVARSNLCFSDHAQSADYEAKQGTVYSFADLPELSKVRFVVNNLMRIAIGENKEAASFLPLKAEGNYYNGEQYIGYHGDSERRFVVGCRFGATMPLCFRWFMRNKTVGPEQRILLNDGDVYIMSDKATGHDWKCSSRLTLRHCAGHSERDMRVKAKQLGA